MKRREGECRKGEEEVVEEVEEEIKRVDEIKEGECRKRVERWKKRWRGWMNRREGKCWKRVERWKKWWKKVDE